MDGSCRSRSLGQRHAHAWTRGARLLVRFVLSPLRDDDDDVRRPSERYPSCMMSLSLHAPPLHISLIAAMHDGFGRACMHCSSLTAADRIRMQRRQTDQSLPLPAGPN